MVKLLEQALDAKRMLRPEFVTAQGFGARIFADYIGREEFQRAVDLAWATGPTDITIYHAEFGAEEQISVLKNADTAWAAIFDQSYEDQIVEFKDRDLFLWLPSGEHLFVAFGDRRLLASLGDPEDAAAEFEDYVENAGLTEQGKAFLRDCARSYQI
ncbi:hypothetical protein [Paracoccus zhejiangensis]|uniref:Uncharacterized protein n=1 Tax=Paracoccus zhejiangensis TaxID=1077935 RepID=A0A2H5F162_9RHOB|nr:hypothetical protein [Paracoccus zhejiangensis]AUH65273.1 hypothetical protein CX676_14795 [Paracoccus zhejiangensis]